MSARPLTFVLLGSIVVALVLRLPALSLPLEGEGARLASQTDALMAHKELPGDPSEGGLLALLATAVAAAGLTPTLGVRVLGLACALLLPLLGFALARRFRLSRGASVGCAFLLGVHPFVVIEVGGALTGSAGVELVLLLAGMLCVTSGSALLRRVGAVTAMALPHVAVSGLVYLPLITVLHQRREPRGPLRVIGLLGSVASLALSPALRALPGPGPVDPVQFLVLWVPLVSLGVLLLGAPRGWRVLAGEDAGDLGVAWRAWSLAAVVHVGLLLGLGLEGDLGLALDGSGGLALVPFVLIMGLAGCFAIRARWMRYGLALASFAALLCTAWLGFGAAQVRLTPGADTAALRLTWQRDVCRRAARLVGQDGWVVLDILADDPDGQRSLADLLKGHWVWRREPLSDEERAHALRPLLTFPAAAWKGGAFAMIRETPTRGGRIGRVDDEVSFGPTAVFDQDAVRRVGPWLLVELQGNPAGLR